MLLNVYHRLPYWGKVLAASAHGYYLNWMRYGPSMEEFVDEALTRERLDSDDLTMLQCEALSRTLFHAARKVPYYRELWQNTQPGAHRRDYEDLSKWPILEKETVRQNPLHFLADDRSRLMFTSHTSGTTGTPLRLFESLPTIRSWYAMSEARWRRWYGVSFGDSYAILGGRLVAPANTRKPPFWVWNHASKQLYLSSYHLWREAIPHYLAALSSYKVTYLLGYTSSLVVLAEEALALGRTDLKMKVVVTNAEPLYPFQRQLIQRAFQCPVRETYGMSETVAAASECEFGKLHLWPMAGVMEVMSGNTPVEPGCVGDLVCTGLVNQDMPLVRYRTGDRGALSTARSCECGRTLPQLDHLEGRADDVLYTCDGRRIGRLDPVFKSDLPLREVQIVQPEIDRLIVRYVPATNFDSAALDVIKDGLRQRMGDIRVEFVRFDQIPRGPNGKVKAVVCELTPDEKNAWGREAKAAVHC